MNFTNISEKFFIGCQKMKDKILYHNDQYHNESPVISDIEHH